MTRYIIATDNASAAQKNAITQAITDKGWGFWHHFQDFWMVATPPSVLAPTSEELFDELQANPAIGQMRMVVMRIPDSAGGITFMGHGPQKGWEWTNDHWVRVG